MSPRVRSWAVAAVVVIAAAGCNAILGNDVHELATQGGQGVSGTTSSGTSGGATSTTTSTSSGASGSTTSSAGGGGGNSSMPDASSTGGSATEGGTTADAHAESSTPVCTPTAKDCQARTLRQCSDVGQWVELGQCPYACVNGACAGTCVPGTKQCSLSTPQRCDDTGNWVNGLACPNICSLGDCTGMCAPNTMQPCGSAATCNASAMQTCGADGTWGDCSPAPSACLSIPMGWQAVAMTHTTCPAGFGQPLTFYTSAKGDDFTCQCGCGGTQSCSGSVTLNEFSPDGGANCSGTPATRTFNITPNCVAANYGNILLPNSYTISNVAYGPAPACSATPKATTQPQVVTQSVSLCSPNAICPEGACLSALESRNLCVSKPGVQTCPNGYPNATVMSSTFDDTRSCGSCSCGSTLTCSLTDVLLNNDSSACTTTHAYWMTANTTSCAAAPTNFPLNAVKALGTVGGDGTCAATSPSAPTGAVTLNANSTVTVCCP